jgi:ATP/maltotriose-dependent transcriptional regulator MalT
MAYAENDGDVAALHRDVSAGVAEWQAVGDRGGLSTALTARAQLRTIDGDLAGAADDLEQAADIVRHLGGTSDHVLVLMRLADLRLRAGDPAGARRHLEAMRSQRSYGAGEVLRGVLVAVTDVGIALVEGDEPAVRQAYAELLGVLDRLGSPSVFAAHGAAVGHATAAAAAVHLGDLAAAEEHLREAHTRAVLTRDRPILAMVGLHVAQWLRASGRPAESAVVLGAARVLRGAADPTNPVTRRLTEQLRADLGDAFDDRLAEGLALDQPGAEKAVEPGYARRR